MRQKAAPDSFGFKPPKIVEAKKYKPTPDRFSPPQIIPVHDLKKIEAGDPEIISLKSNIHTAKVKRLETTGSPKVIIPNGKSFQPPKVVPAIDSPFTAGPPEIILLKEPLIKR